MYLVACSFCVVGRVVVSTRVTFLSGSVVLKEVVEVLVGHQVPLSPLLYVVVFVSALDLHCNCLGALLCAKHWHNPHLVSIATRMYKALPINIVNNCPYLWSHVFIVQWWRWNVFHTQLHCLDNFDTGLSAISSPYISCIVSKNHIVELRLLIEYHNWCSVSKMVLLTGSWCPSTRMLLWPSYVAEFLLARSYARKWNKLSKSSTWRIKYRNYTTWTPTRRHQAEAKCKSMTLPNWALKITSEDIICSFSISELRGSVCKFDYSEDRKSVV